MFQQINEELEVIIEEMECKLEKAVAEFAKANGFINKLTGSVDNGPGNKGVSYTTEATYPAVIYCRPMSNGLYDLSYRVPLRNTISNGYICKPEEDIPADFKKEVEALIKIKPDDEEYKMNSTELAEKGII